MMARNQILEYRNAVYFGQASLAPQKRKGCGLLVTDLGQVIFGNWDNDILDGKYFYSDGHATAYGYMKAGTYDDWNVLTQGDLTVWCQCQAGLFNGNVVIKMATYQPEAYEFSSGEKVKEISLLSTSDPVKTLLPKIQMNLELFLDTIVNDQTCQSTLGAIKLPSVSYYGSIDFLSKTGDGLGFTIGKSSVTGLGRYKDTRLHGLGRKYTGSGDFEDGVFSEGRPAAMIFRWFDKKSQFTQCNYSGKQIQTLTRGTTYPKQAILDMREEFHIRSMKFVNDWVCSQDLVNVDLSSIRISRPESLKARTDDIVQKLAQHYLNASPNKSKSSAKKTQQQTLSRYKTAQKVLAFTNIVVSQQSPQQVLTDKRVQAKLKQSEYSPVAKTNIRYNDDNLNEAIRQYQELQRVRLTRK